MIVRLSCSDVGIDELNVISSVIDNGYLGMGSYVEQFELALKDYLGTNSHVICVNSGTAALHLSLQSLDISHGDEVLVPSITYLASFQAITACGAIPVACDVSPLTLFIDPDDARNRITRSTKAIMPVHYASSNLGIDPIYSLASEFGLHVVEDAAHSFGSYGDNGLIGSTENMICFSFDGIKNITSGEGGAIVTNDDSLASYIRDARLLGVAGDSIRRSTGQRTWFPDVHIQGWRYHMSNVFAAIGLSQLEKSSDLFSKRKRLVQAYLTQLSTIDSIQLLRLNHSALVPHIFPIRIPACKRDRVRRLLGEDGIQTGFHYFPNHLLTKFRVSYSLPVSESAGETLISLPLHTKLTSLDQSFVIERLLYHLHVA